jgi:DNA (cytosine-5)-methyltransferase 1
MGGMSLAASQLGLDIVFGVDSNAEAIRTFSKNFPEALALQGSVRSPAVLDQCALLLRPPDGPAAPSVIVSGPPCQGFSDAGSRDPLDPRNRVFGAVALAIAKLQPDGALVENVEAVLSEKHSKRLRSFERVLEEAGYNVCTIILDADDFGVPQKRRRTFFLISRIELDESDVLNRIKRFRLEPVTVRAALEDLPIPAVRPDDYNDECDYATIPNHFAMRHSSGVIQKISAIEPGTGPMSYRRLHPTRLSNSLFSGHRAPPAHFSEPRSITTREAARLQGFPDSFRVYGAFSNQMEQVTNAVPPAMTRAALSVLLDLSGVKIR